MLSMLTMFDLAYLITYFVTGPPPRDSLVSRMFMSVYVTLHFRHRGICRGTRLFGQNNILRIMICASEGKNIVNDKGYRDVFKRRIISPRVRTGDRRRVINLVSYSLSIVKGKRPQSLKCVPKEAILP